MPYPPSLKTLSSQAGQKHQWQRRPSLTACCVVGVLSASLSRVCIACCMVVLPLPGDCGLPPSPPVQPRSCPWFRKLVLILSKTSAFGLAMLSTRPTTSSGPPESSADIVLQRQGANEQRANDTEMIAERLPAKKKEVRRAPCLTLDPTQQHTEHSQSVCPEREVRRARLDTAEHRTLSECLPRTEGKTSSTRQSRTQNTFTV